MRVANSFTISRFFGDLSFSLSGVDVCDNLSIGVSRQTSGRDWRSADEHVYSVRGAHMSRKRVSLWSICDVLHAKESPICNAHADLLTQHDDTETRYFKCYCCPSGHSHLLISRCQLALQRVSRIRQSALGLVDACRIAPRTTQSQSILLCRQVCYIPANKLTSERITYPVQTIMTAAGR